MLRYTAIISAGVVSFEPSPYLPENTGTSLNSVPLRAATTSKYNGSPSAPGSLVLSNTLICFTVLGSAATKCLALNVLYILTLITLTFYPAFNKSTINTRILIHTELNATITCSASSAP